MHNAVQVIKKSNGTNQIVMFPFGGGSGYSYMELIKTIDASAEILVINPPGRLLDKAAPLKTIEDMVQLYSTTLLPLLKTNCLFFGHSIGGIVAYETYKVLQDKKDIKKLIISNINPPHCVKNNVDLHSDMDKETLIKKSMELGGMPQLFMDEPELLGMFIGGLKADLIALEAYQPLPLNSVKKMKIKSVVLYSNKDYIIDSKNLKDWEYYIDCTEFIEFPGDHFYLFENSNRIKLAQILTTHVNRMNTAIPYFQ